MAMLNNQSVNFVQHSEQIPGSMCIGRMAKERITSDGCDPDLHQVLQEIRPFLSKKSSDWAAGLARKFQISHVHYCSPKFVFPLCVYELYICLWLCVSVRLNRLPAIWPGGWMIPVLANGWKLWKANVFDQCLFVNQWLAGIRCTNCRDFKGPKAIHIIYLECRIESRLWDIYICIYIYIFKVSHWREQTITDVVYDMGLFENMVSLNPLVKHHFPFKWPCLGIPIFLEKAPANVELHWYYPIPSYSLEANWLAPMLTVAKPCFGSWSAVGQPAVTARWGGSEKLRSTASWRCLEFDWPWVGYGHIWKLLILGWWSYSSHLDDVNLQIGLDIYGSSPQNLSPNNQSQIAKMASSFKSLC